MNHTKTPTQLLKQLDRSLSISAEDQLELRPVMRAITVWQEFPDIALVNLSGIFIPPHERTMMYALHQGASQNINVSSRGTAKSSAVCVLYANYKMLLFAKRRFVTLSATGFRGGQLIFEEINRWLNGAWEDQDRAAGFFRKSCKYENLIHRAQNFWKLEYDSLSSNITIPTNDEDRMRGLRGTDLIIDEANTADEEMVTKVANSFLNVLGDFKHGGAESHTNQTYYTSTIDFNWRWLQKKVRAALEGIYRDWQAAQALARGDIKTFKDLHRIGLHEYTYVSFDYTDVLVREIVTTREGESFRVKWPDDNIPITHDERGIPYVEKAEDGRMRRIGNPINYYRTYPINKKDLEIGLYDGVADESSWWAEQRNIVDSASGDVYSHDLVDRASCVGKYAITEFAKTSSDWQRQHDEDKLDYFPPLLWECKDPCVLGVDYATQSDFTAFVVIRLGPLASGDYNYITGEGRTQWSNVIWAEQYRRMTHTDVAMKIHELRHRYNLVYNHEPHITDTWEMCRAIGLDMRGGGHGVRDQLAQLNKPHLTPPEVRIIDPLDRDDRILAYALDANSLPMLDGIWPSAELNAKLVQFSVAQMEQNLLYIAKYLDRSQRPANSGRLDIGYDAVHNLAWQLRKLRKEMSQTQNWPRFYVEGDTNKDVNKKDLWAALMYAAKQARAHLIRQRAIDTAIPAMGAIAVRVNKKSSFDPLSYSISPLKRRTRRLL